VSFRRRPDEWTDLIRRHRAQLLSCGIPEDVFSDRARFLVFIDHGYDETGWFASPHEAFDSTVLTDDQVSQLARFVSQHIGEFQGKLVASRWRQYPGDIPPPGATDQP